MMDPIIYNAVAVGNIDVLRMQNADQLRVQLAPNNNTVLHVASEFGQIECVREILHKCGRSLLSSMNIKGDNSLHISARKGFASVVQQLIEYAKEIDTELESRTGTTKEMLRMRNLEGDTALHEAVRKKENLDVVEILTKEDSDFVHSPNNVEETPLFLAAERGNIVVVSKILENCTSPAYSGPNGRTVLHAAIINNEEYVSRLECINKLYIWKPLLIKEADVFGWRPLHYAAWERNTSIVTQLLDMDRSIAYLVVEDDEKTALHMAASLGNTNVMEEILLRCPDCWKMNNSKGQNILHIAAEHEKENTINFILKNSFASSLINQKDIDGNTPLHLLATTSSYKYDRYKYDRLIKHPEVDRKACNKENITAREIQPENDSSGIWVASRNKYKLPPKMKASKKEDEEASKKEDEEDPKLKKIMDAQLIVATLIATVTFTAGFTVPGGYDGNKGPNHGMAILARRAAFIAFVVADTMAVGFSITSVFTQIVAYSYDDEESRVDFYSIAFLSTVWAMEAMMIAFMTGLSVVLAHSSSGLAITVCLICCFFFYFTIAIVTDSPFIFRILRGNRTAKRILKLQKLLN